MQKGYSVTICEQFGLAKRSAFLGNTLILFVPKINAQEIGGGSITSDGEARNRHQILFAKLLKGNGLLERSGRRWEADKAIMDRKEIKYGGVNSIYLFMIKSSQLLLWRR